jgi:RNase P subunit RPR2
MPSSNSGQNVIRIMCPQLNCQRVLAVPTTARGKLVRCRSCGTTIRIPVIKAKEEAPAPPQQQQGEAA